jgi:hypothetical protein
MLAITGLFDPPSNETGIWSGFVHPYNNPAESVYHYVLDHHEQVLCPGNPLITLLADNKLYDAYTVLFDRLEGGLLPDQQRFFDHLPQNISQLIYAYEPQTHYLENSLINFRRQVAIPELPYCIVITR